MKVYLEEKDMPKSCHDCCFNCECFCCIKNNYVIDDFFQDTKNKDCPLQSLADHDKQVRKEVCEKIGKNVSLDKVKGKLYARYEDLERILDQIQGDCDEKINSKT